MFLPAKLVHGAVKRTSGISMLPEDHGDHGMTRKQLQAVQVGLLAEPACSSQEHDQRGDQQGHTQLAQQPRLNAQDAPLLWLSFLNIAIALRAAHVC